MSADRHRPGILLCLLLLLQVPAQGSWLSCLDQTVYPEKAYQETPLLFILRDIFSTAEKNCPDRQRPPIELLPGADVDLQQPVTIRFPELYASEALAYLGRRSGIAIRLSGNQVRLWKDAPRTYNLSPQLEEQLLLQQLLFTTIAQTPVDPDTEIRDYAIDLLARAAVLKTAGHELAGRPPAEYAAFYLLLQLDAMSPILQARLAEATPAGRVYLAALLGEMQSAPEGSAWNLPVAVREAEGLIFFMPGEEVFQEQVAERLLYRSVMQSLKQNP